MRKRPHAHSGAQTHTDTDKTHTDTDKTHMDSVAQANVTQMCARTPYHMKAQREIQPHARHPPHVQLCSPGPSLPPQAIPQTPYRLHHAHSSPPSPPVPRPRYLLQALPSLDGRVSVNSMHIREPPACRCARILTKTPAPHEGARRAQGPAEE